MSEIYDYGILGNAQLQLIAVSLLRCQGHQQFLARTLGLNSVAVLLVPAPIPWPTSWPAVFAVFLSPAARTALRPSMGSRTSKQSQVLNKLGTRDTHQRLVSRASELRGVRSKPCLQRGACHAQQRAVLMATAAVGETTAITTHSHGWPKNTHVPSIN